MFVIDTTGSMDSYIDGTKALVKSLIDEYKKNGLILTVGFVGYKDYKEEYYSIQYSNEFNYREFDTTFKATGG